MTDLEGEATPDAPDGITGNPALQKEAFQATLTELDELADEMAADGWETAAVPAVQAAPESPAAGSTDRWGVVFTVPGNVVEELETAFAAGEFPEYDVYRRTVDRELFLVVVYRDPASGTAVLVAGGLPMAYSDPLLETVDDQGTVHTHVRTLDDTVIASFVHDDPGKFFPGAEGA